MPFEEIAPIVGRSPAAARQLASRARRRVQGTPPPDADLGRQRQVVDAFLAAARGGDFDALVALLDPDVVHAGRPRRSAPGGARRVPRRAAVFEQARTFAQLAALARPALVNGAAGFVVARGRAARRGRRDSPSRTGGSSRSTCSPTRAAARSSTCRRSTAEERRQLRPAATSCWYFSVMCATACVLLLG